MDETLRREGSGWGDPGSYGASVGAVRGTVRDALKRYPSLSRDGVTALSSELWRRRVPELRLAAVVLLQSRATMLRASDLTRIEGFLREGASRDLVDLLAVDVVGMMVAGLDARDRARADAVLDRWAGEPDEWLRRAAVLSGTSPPGSDDEVRFEHRIRLALAGGESAIVTEAVERARGS